MKRIHLLGLIGVFTFGLSRIALADDDGQRFRVEQQRQGSYGQGTYGEGAHRGNDRVYGDGYGNTRSTGYHRGNGYNYGNNRYSGSSNGYYRDVDYRRDVRYWNAGYPQTIRRPDYDRDRGCHGRDGRRWDNRRYVR